MLGLHTFYTRLKQRLEMRTRVQRHPKNGLLCQRVYGGEVFLRDYDAYIPESRLNRLCKDVYFREYLPQGGDTVVDIGAGYGHEAMFCRLHSPSVRYIGVEVQPSVYECLANTFGPYRPTLRACPMAISNEQLLQISSAQGTAYESVGATSDGLVEVPTIAWPDFLARFSIDRIALLKVNIEGGERHLLPALGQLSEIDRVIISSHDFRADRGDGELFRTRQFVMDYLRDCGLAPRSLIQAPWWRDWIFASRSGRE